MENTVKRSVGQFQMGSRSLICLNLGKDHYPQLLGVGNFESGTNGAFIDNPPDHFLDEHDVLLLRDKNGDGFLDGEDAKGSLQEIKDLLTQNKRPISAEELIDLGYVALTGSVSYAYLFRGRSAEQLYNQGFMTLPCRFNTNNIENVYFVNQPHDATLSWYIHGKKQALVSLKGVSTSRGLMQAEIKETE